ncbi:MAG: TSUP family transporter, partial [Gemmatimonadetes bacterium]|nr:TSUP family transporter [Gemmatimonadota bacterium]
MTAVILVAIGLVAGILSGIFGVGGGIIIVPALLFLVRMSPQAAVGTSLGALLAPVGLLAAISYARAGQLDRGA